MNAEHSSTIKLEQYAWTAVKAVFVLLILSLVLNPSTKGRSGLVGGAPETVLPARIRAAGVHTVNAEMSGTIVRLTVKAGDTVTAGQVLARIDNPAIEEMIERASRRVALAKQRLDNPPAGGAGAPASAQRKWLDEQHAAAVKNLRAAEQRMSEFSPADAEKASARARANADRIRGLLEQRLATAREAEEAQREADNEWRNLNARREAGVRLKQELEAAHSQVKMAKLQLESAAAQLTAPAADSGYARLEYEEAVAAHETLLRKLDALQVTAPAGGTLIQVNAERGGPVQEGAILFQIADSSKLNFDVSAPASMARAIHRGDPVLVRVPVDPPVEVPATVSQVLLEPDPQQQSYLIRVTIPNPAADRLLVGLEGAVSFNH